MENPSKKRRSFVDMRRKSLVFDRMFGEDGVGQVPELTMSAYVSSLKTERLQWKEVIQAKSKRLKKLKDNCDFSTVDLKAKDVEPFLTQDEKAFLEDAPDYHKMMKYIDKYMQTINYLERYKCDVVESYNNAFEESLRETNAVVKRLRQNDVCELCNKINCKNIHHAFPDTP